VLILPGELTARDFLGRYWQKQALYMPAALGGRWPSLSRNELAWLATQEDVESRLVFVERGRYRAESGPFSAADLQKLPKRNWTLLVHDVEKHLPALRRLFAFVPFIPDWRIDDLMVSFAAPGGGVGPHRDNYDVFLCQGIGIRQWRFSAADIAANGAASQDLALLDEFDGERRDAVAGDVLYLPPGIAHWGIAKRACMTYSIGMRAPEASDLLLELGAQTPGNDEFYSDADLDVAEAAPGWISPAAVQRAQQLPGVTHWGTERVEEALGKAVTRTKHWLSPDGVAGGEALALLDWHRRGGLLQVHGMSRIAYGACSVFVNGQGRAATPAAISVVRAVCETRRLLPAATMPGACDDLLLWLIRSGAFEIPETF